MIEGVKGVSNWIGQNIDVYRKLIGVTRDMMGHTVNDFYRLIFKRVKMQFDGLILNFMSNNDLHAVDSLLHRKWEMLVEELNGKDVLKRSFPCQYTQCELGNECPLNKRVILVFNKVV